MGANKKEEQYDSKNIESLNEHNSKVLELIVENPSREDLIKTPERVAKAMQFLTHGYEMNAIEILQSTIFSEDYSQMVLVKESSLNTTSAFSGAFLQSEKTILEFMN